MHQLLCSTGALIGRPNGRDYRLIASCVPRLQCDGFEFMMYETWYDQVEPLSKFLSALQLNIPVMHCEKHIGEAVSRRDAGDWENAVRHFEINCQLAAFLGAKKMVMHLWDGMTSDRHFENNLASYGMLKETARKHGVDLMIENVVCSQQDPLSHWRSLLEQDPQAHFTFDTKMAAFHGQMDALYLPENRRLWTDGHIAHLHLNDYGGGYMDWSNLKTLHIGKGNIDFERFFSFLREIPYDGDYTIEATSFLPDGVIHCDDLNRTFSLVRQYLR